MQEAGGATGTNRAHNQRSDGIVIVARLSWRGRFTEIDKELQGRHKGSCWRGRHPIEVAAISRLG